jgi:hypothetical protein
LFEAGAAGRCGTVAFRQTDHADRDRSGQVFPRRAVCLFQPDDLGRTAADIEHQGAVIFAADQGGAAVGGQIGFLFRRNDFQIQSRLLARAADQGIGIAGQPCRLRGDGTHMLDVMLGNAVGTDFQRGNGPVHGGLGQKTALVHPLAQPHDPREGVHDPEARRSLRAGDQQTAIVGPQVQDRQ